MTSAFREIARQKPDGDDGFARLLCTEPGCGHRWSVYMDRPLCSFHAFPRTGTRYESMESIVPSDDLNSDGKRWARRIIQRGADGANVRPYSLKLAKQALGMA